MRKNSAMGGGEFEYNPRNFEKKINEREKFFNNNYIRLENFINDIALEYSKLGLGNFENCKKELLKRSVLKMREGNKYDKL